eukprot:UN14865
MTGPSDKLTAAKFNIMSEGFMASELSRAYTWSIQL